jgi:SprT-like family
MWDYFNVTLFGSSLRKVFLNFSRRARSLGFFAPKRWESGDQVTHEISLNPTHLKRGSARDMASTLVHEMVHVWHSSTASRSDPVTMMSSGRGRWRSLGSRVRDNLLATRTARCC